MGQSLHQSLHHFDCLFAVPPKWTLEPKDVSVSAGHSLAIHCQAEGHPTPSITWKRAVGKKTIL